MPQQNTRGEMFNGTAIFLGCIFIGLGIAVTGAVSEYEKQALASEQIAATQAACWAPATLSGLNSLATQEGATVLKASYPDDMSQQEQDAVTASFAATLSSYAFIGASADNSTVNCDASISFNYTRPDKSSYTNDDGHVVTYSIHPSQGGWQSEMSGADFLGGVVSYTDNPNPPPPPAPVATAPAQPVSAAPAPLPPEVADYDQGHAERIDWENWVNGLQGPEKQGAIFWSAQRSLASPETCENGSEDAFPNDATDQVSFQNGCQEATLRLAASDIKRKSDPLYKAGWNAPLPTDTSADGSTPSQ